MLDEILEYASEGLSWLGEAVVSLVPSDWSTGQWSAFLLVWGGISIYIWFFGYYFSMSGGGVERYNLFLRIGAIIGVSILTMFFINNQR
jgi:hypothetical protein